MLKPLVEYVSVERFCLIVALQYYVPGDGNKREPDMDWMGRMGSITLHSQLSLSGSRLLPSPGSTLITWICNAGFGAKLTYCLTDPDQSSSSSYRWVSGDWKAVVLTPLTQSSKELIDNISHDLKLCWLWCFVLIQIPVRVEQLEHDVDILFVHFPGSDSYI